MPEYPDITVYNEAIERDYLGQPLERLRVLSPFIVRSYEPKTTELHGLKLQGMRRLGKRLVFAFENELFLVLHLMIAGRLKQRPKGTSPARKAGLAAFDFPESTLILTEESPKKRASIYVVRGEEALAEHDPGGLEPMTASLAQFAERLRSENHTLKRSLCDPHLFAAIGNAYSDEILHKAKLSPVLLSSRITDAQIETLYDAMHSELTRWTNTLREKTKGKFPEKVTAFLDEMAVHGKYDKPCPVCGSPVQRIRRAASDSNYCATCQTGGKLLADRSLSRLLHDDWPDTLEEMELKRGRVPSVPKVEAPAPPAKKAPRKRKPPA